MGTGAVLLLLVSHALAAGVNDQQSDTMSVTLDTTIRVIDRHISRYEVRFPIEKDRFNEILSVGGFGLVRKGTFFAQDIYAEGFKRGDVTVVFDGERIHSACPNRMDAPLTRVNPLEVAAVDLRKNPAELQGGIGGMVSYVREPLPADPIVRGGTSGSFGATDATDFTALVSGVSYRFSGRYARGTGYEDARGRDFVELYGYRENTTYTLAEVATLFGGDLWQGSGSVTYSRDVMFPYLMMDERENTMVALSLAYGRHKIYFNGARHLMDNGLRRSMMGMQTDARSFTAGVVGPNYEVYYHHWDADNTIATSTMRLENHIIPRVGRLTATVGRKLRTGPWTLWGKAGLTYFRVGDDDRLSFFAPLFGTVNAGRWFPDAALGLRYTRLWSARTLLGVAGDLAVTAPQAEYLFLALARPMGREWWSGNPVLASVMRGTLRAELRSGPVSFELFGSRVWGYVEPVGRTADGRAYRTFESTDALLFGFSTSAQWRYLSLYSAYTWAENLTVGGPLSEIAPLSVRVTLRTPAYRNLSGFVRHTYNDAQTRVAAGAGEYPTGAWHRTDLGCSYETKAVRIVLTVENVANRPYVQHLSYLRNPYRDGTRVWEPGRTFRVSLVFDRDSAR